MSAYTADQERAVRVGHRLKDWWKSELISEEQHDRMAADLQTGLRRTNVFLRATLLVLGFIIAVAATGLIGVMIDAPNDTVWILFAIGAAGCLAAATLLVSKFHLYRFGIEEAFALAGILFAGAAVGILFGLTFSNDTTIGIGLLAASVVACVVFFWFGFVYAAAIGVACAATAAFPILEADMASRLIGVAILAAIFFAARIGRANYGDEFPGDNYAVIEAVAWGGVYLLLNLRASSWLSQPAEDGAFYWITYAVTWMLPAAGLWIAVRERHRLLLDLNIVLAIVTMMTNKMYLGAERQPWDPIVFGMLLIAVALGVRRWLASGDGGARHGFVPYRLLASERDRLSAAGSVSVVQPSLHPQHGARPPEPEFGGGRSGGAGASGNF
jgi:hypothetical protein